MRNEKICNTLDHVPKRNLDHVSTAYRVLARGEFSGCDVAIDRYGDFLCVWSYNEHAPMPKIVNEVKPCIAYCESLYQTKGAVVKRVRRNPHHGAWIDDRFILGETPPPYFLIHEHGLSYEVTLTESQHVGFFLDQRDNRKRVMDVAQGLRVANLFAYSSSFSVAAAAAGAEVVFSVDTSPAALRLGKRNFEVNDLTRLNVGKFVEADVRDWLTRQMKKVASTHEQATYAEDQTNRALFGLIICDPPTFSSTRDRGDFSVERDWASLAEGCRAILRPGGHALFSTNHRDGDSDRYETILKAQFKRVERLPAPVDFASDPRHMTAFWCES